MFSISIFFIPILSKQRVDVFYTGTMSFLPSLFSFGLLFFFFADFVCCGFCTINTSSILTFVTSCE